jgi:hypothetical protein
MGHRRLDCATQEAVWCGTDGWIVWYRRLDNSQEAGRCGTKCWMIVKKAGEYAIGGRMIRVSKRPGSAFNLPPGSRSSF